MGEFTPGESVGRMFFRVNKMPKTQVNIFKLLCNYMDFINI